VIALLAVGDRETSAARAGPSDDLDQWSQEPRALVGDVTRDHHEDVDELAAPGRGELLPERSLAEQ